MQFLLRNHFRIADVFAVRIARAVHRFSKFPQADSSVTITYTNDEHPDFQLHESKSAEVDIFAISGSYKARVIQCLQKQGVMPMLLDDYNVSNELTGTPSAQQRPTQQSGTLDTIPEGDEGSQSDDDLIMGWQAELDSDASLEPIFSLQNDGKITVTSELPADMPEYTPTFFQAQTHLCESTQSVLFHIHDPDDESLVDPHHYTDMPISIDQASHSDTVLDKDSNGPYVELCFTSDMSPIVLSEAQLASMTPGDIATMRVYISANVKRSVVVKEDDLLTKRSSHTTKQL